MNLVRSPTRFDILQHLLLAFPPIKLVSLFGRILHGIVPFTTKEVSAPVPVSYHLQTHTVVPNRNRRFSLFSRVRCPTLTSSPVAVLYSFAFYPPLCFFCFGFGSFGVSISPKEYSWSCWATYFPPFNLCDASFGRSKDVPSGCELSDFACACDPWLKTPISIRTDVSLASPVNLLWGSFLVLLSLVRKSNQLLLLTRVLSSGNRRVPPPAIARCVLYGLSWSCIPFAIHSCFPRRPSAPPPFSSPPKFFSPEFSDLGT